MTLRKILLIIVLGAITFYIGCGYVGCRVYHHFEEKGVKSLWEGNHGDNK